MVPGCVCPLKKQSLVVVSVFPQSPQVGREECWADLQRVRLLGENSISRSGSQPLSHSTLLSEEAQHCLVGRATFDNRNVKTPN